jgi:hypothetical protein
MSRIRPLSYKGISYKYRPYVINAEEFITLEEIAQRAEELIELIALCEVYDMHEPQLEAMRAELESLENQKQQIITMPVLERQRRNHSKHLFKSVDEAMTICDGRLDHFTFAFKFKPEQVRELASKLFPNGFRTLQHGSLLSEEAMLILLCAYRCAHGDSFQALGRFMDRNHVNLGRHIAHMTKYLDDVYCWRLFDPRMLPHHAQYVDPQHPGLVPEWMAAYPRTFASKLPDVAYPPSFQHVMGAYDGHRIDIARCVVGPLEEASYSGYSKSHNILVLPVIVPNGRITTLVGPFTGHNNDLVGCTGQLRNVLIAIGGKLLCDSIFPQRDFLAPLPKEAQQQAQNIASVQVAGMSSLRMPVEWAIGDAQRSFPLVFTPSRQKLLETDIAARLRVTYFLQNLHTILYGSETSKYFRVRQHDGIDEHLALAQIDIGPRHAEAGD